jgi:hypothetical protein
MLLKAKRVLIPEFEIMACPTFKISDLKRRFGIKTPKLRIICY